MASDPQTWTELKSSLAEWLNRADLTAKIPEFIALAERKFDRVLIVPEREAVSATVTAADSALNLPTGYWEMRSVQLTADPKVTLQPMSSNELNRSYQNNTTGQPQAYAIVAGQLVFGPVPDAAYAISMDYYTTIPKLGSGQATNWLLTAHPDLYIWTSLLMAEAYLWNDKRLDVWKAASDETLGEIIETGNRKNRGPIRLRNPVKGWV